MGALKRLQAMGYTEDDLERSNPYNLPQGGTMNQDRFKSVYGESRNGCNSKIRHPLARQLVYSDGVQELAEIGCYWLLDVVGTEFIKPMRKHAELFDGMAFLHVDVKDEKAVITLAQDEGEKPVYTRRIDYTDMPEGKWIFYMAEEESHVFMFLPTEY